MASRRFFAFLLLISSRIFFGFSQHLGNFFKGMDSDLIPPCMQKILPCQPFIKLPENPLPVCCLPLKEMLAGDLPCLCSFFNNAEMLKSLNVTQSQALKLPKACGAADVDISACNHHAGPPSTGSTDAPPSPPAPKTSDGSSPSKPDSSSRSNNPTYGIDYGFAAASSFVALLLSAL
ncbi:non-specific lipid transfer protein GPI-anchored 8-like [Benincasa hispida]|uniref:non-specific lipid transfer protein GPI-anchored 8-like n=1 Tax=Benincasa hispida TaxID=102211 RepID=UPI0019023438|nr:non-specific lipid transfer protein GPI-anchored 8-like [Benincasa hispida]XP_038895530.1 non-specific lipid transfer protein GPI-anchored 8-like [Benincasa hispida]